MGKIERFEEIRAWQGARALCRHLYEVTGRRPFGRDYALKDQLRRAALSVMLNIAEGFARRTTGEFIHFLYIAHGSAAEIQAALYVARDQRYLDEENFHALYAEVERVSMQIAGFIRYLNGHAERRR